MITRPKIFTFDFFGTVLDWRRGLIEGVERCGRTLDDRQFELIIRAQARMEQERFRLYADIVADSLVEVLGLARAHADAIGTVAGQFPLYPDSKDALHRLMKIAPCAALTNSDLAHKAQILSVLGPLTAWACAEELGVYKPAIEFFQRARDRLGIEQGASWWHVSAYGDYDLATATELGLTRVFVRRPHHVLGRHDLAVDSLSELADWCERELSA